MLLQGVRVMVAVAEKKKKVEGLVAESVGERWTTSIDQNIKDTCLQGGLNVRYRRGWYWKMEDIEQAKLTDCHRDLLRQFEVKAGLVIPIVVADIESI
jgi:hypothetical protein